MKKKFAKNFKKQADFFVHFNEMCMDFIALLVLERTCQFCPPVILFAKLLETFSLWKKLFRERIFFVQFGIIVSGRYVKGYTPLGKNACAITFRHDADRPREIRGMRQARAVLDSVNHSKFCDTFLNSDEHFAPKIIRPENRRPLRGLY